MPSEQKGWFDQFDIDTHSVEYRREATLLEVTEAICRVMDNQSVSRAELARRLGKTKGHVTQLLSGTRNMTIQTLSDILTVLGKRLHVSTPALKEPDVCRLQFPHWQSESVKIDVKDDVHWPERPKLAS